MNVDKKILHKLRDSITNLVKSNKSAGSKTNNISGEVGILAEYLQHDDHSISLYASNLLFQMVTDNIIESNVLLTICVSQSALNKPYHDLLLLVLRILSHNASTERQTPPINHLKRIFQNQKDSANIFMATLHRFLIVCMKEDQINDGKTCHVNTAVGTMKAFIQSVVANSPHALTLVEEILDFLSTLKLFSPSDANNIFLLMVEGLKVQIIDEARYENRITVILKLVKSTFNHTILQDLCPDELFNTQLDLISLLVDICWRLTNERKKAYRLLEGLFHLNILLKHVVNNLELISFNKLIWKHLSKQILFILAMMLMKVDEDIAEEILKLMIVLLQVYQSSPNGYDEIILLSVITMPVLQILSERPSEKIPFKSRVHCLADNIMFNIHSKLNTPITSDFQGLTNKLPVSGNNTSEILNVAHCSLFVIKSLACNKATAVGWLSNLKQWSKRDEIENVNENIILTLSSLLVLLRDQDISKTALQTLIAICKRQSSLVKWFMPLLFYFLNNSSYNHMKIHILYTFPELATDKHATASTLKVLVSLSTNGQLLPVAIRTMTLLWRKQPRVFPYLHQLLTGKINPNSNQWHQITLAKVASVLEICKLRPTQHGKDMIIILSAILEELIKLPNIQSDVFRLSVSANVLLTESLKLLCLAQVIDIESIWKAVVSKLQLINHPAVLTGICSLLSCVPGCVSEDKETFLDEVVKYLWFIAGNHEKDVASTAFKALSYFPPVLTRVGYLPKEVHDSVCQKLLHKTRKTNNSEEEIYIPLNDICPGFAYVDLLFKIPEESLPGFQLLLQKVLQSEVDTLPRGIGRKIMSNSPKAAYGDLPEILRKQYETSARPGVLPGVAAGLLCCYEPLVPGLDVDQPSAKHLLLISARYQQTLDSLLQDFAIQPNNWHHMMVAPTSWCNFMEKLYTVVIEGRKADIEQRKKKGEFLDEEQYTDEINSIKFWCRDQLLNQLRKASKGSPKVQGNSVLALVGLANAVSSHELVDARENNQVVAPDQYVSTRRWLLSIVDTVMVIFDGNFKPKCKPFQWCQQVSSEKSTASSFASRCCAAISLSELTRLLLSRDTERIHQMVEALKIRCPGNTKTGTMSSMELHCALGLGMILARLYQQQFYEIGGVDGSTIMLTSLHLLRDIALDEGVIERDGAIVGYGLAIASVFAYDSRRDSQVHARKAYENLRTYCMNLENENLATVSGQALLFSLAFIASNAYLADNTSVEDLYKCYVMVEEKVSAAQQYSDLHISVGLLCNQLLKSRNPKYLSNVTNQLETWRDTLVRKESNPLQRLGAVKGILCSIGVDDLLFQINSETDTSEKESFMKNYLSLIINELYARDIIVSLHTSHLLGQLYLAVHSIGNASQTPQSFSYLKDTFLLPALFNNLLKASNEGPYGSYKDTYLSCLLQSLNELVTSRLPPVNWALVFMPLLRTGWSSDVKHLCVKFVIKFLNSEQSLLLLISSWLQTNTFHKMTPIIQKEILNSVVPLLPNLTNSKQRYLLEVLPLECLRKTEDLLEAVLKMWCSVLKMATPIQSTVAYVMAAFETFIKGIREYSEAELLSNMPLITQCAYSLLRNDWRNILPELPPSTYVSLSFEIEILNHADKLESNDILQITTSPFTRNSALVLFFKVLIQLAERRHFADHAKSMLLTLAGRYRRKDLFSPTEDCLVYYCMLLIAKNDTQTKQLAEVLADVGSLRLFLLTLKNVAKFLRIPDISREDNEKIQFLLN